MPSKCPQSGKTDIYMGNCQTGCMCIDGGYRELMRVANR